MIKTSESGRCPSKGDEAAAVCYCRGAGAGDAIEPRYDSSPHWVSGELATGAGPVPKISTRLVFVDRAGSWKVRWGIGRANYAVRPGLYAVGEPDAGSPVFVSANYKMSFDRLRSSLAGLDCWVLVLDTKGINVWCAAGKGTFGTAEVVRSVEETGLTRVVSHRILILPQLGAPGVAADEVHARTGFSVVFGPVRADDIGAFMAAGMAATPAMRRVRFDFRDRVVLAPLELATVIRHPAFLAILFLGIVGLAGVRFLSLDILAVLGAVLVGTVLVPALLPWIPGRALSWKGWILGLAWAGAVCAYRGIPPASPAAWAAALSYGFLLPAFSAFLAMNFTGSTTYTSLSGVLREMKIALPLIILSGVAGLGAGLAALLLQR